MPIGSPIKLSFYGPDDEVIHEYSRSTIPWGILKRAVSLSKTFGEAPDQLTEEDLDSIAQLVVDLFGEQFTLDELNKCVDIGDMMTVIQSIVSRAGALVKANPTIPPSSKTKK